MPYRFATDDQDFSDLASGRVIYNQPSAPAFPVRLASEIFQRALHHLQLDRRITLYDPTCGGAYHLAALGFLHGDQIASILASDIDPNILDLARRNLGLLSEDGLAQREEEIRRMLAEFGKESHAEALASVARLRQRLHNMRLHNMRLHDMRLQDMGLHHLRMQDLRPQDLRPQMVRTVCRIFAADALDAAALQAGLAGEAVDLVFSDVPYGHLTSWQAGTGGDIPPLWKMLDALRPILGPRSLVAIAADKSQKATHEAYQRVERFPLGKRQVTFLRLQ